MRVGGCRVWRRDLVKLVRKGGNVRRVFGGGKLVVTFFVLIEMRWDEKERKEVKRKKKRTTGG